MLKSMNGANEGRVEVGRGVTGNKKDVGVLLVKLAVGVIEG